jgi:hypothetical protein
MVSNFGLIRQRRLLVGEEDKPNVSEVTWTIGLVDIDGNGGASISRSLVTKPVVENAMLRAIIKHHVAKGENQRRPTPLLAAQAKEVVTVVQTQAKEVVMVVQTQAKEVVMVVEVVVVEVVVAIEVVAVVCLRIFEENFRMCFLDDFTNFYCAFKCISIY